MENHPIGKEHNFYKTVPIKKHHHHTFPIPFPHLANQFLCRIVSGRLLQQPAEDAAAEDIASHLQRRGATETTDPHPSWCL